MESTDREILRRFRLLLSRRLTVNRLVLFGSRARGDSAPDSDMDVLVVLDDRDQDVEDYVSDCAWEAGIDYGVVVCPITCTTEEWESARCRVSLLAKAIREEGISV